MTLSMKRIKSWATRRPMQTTCLLNVCVTKSTPIPNKIHVILKCPSPPINLSPLIPTSLITPPPHSPHSKHATPHPINPHSHYITPPTHSAHSKYMPYHTRLTPTPRTVNKCHPPHPLNPHSPPQ